MKSPNVITAYSINEQLIFLGFIMQLAYSSIGSSLFNTLARGEVLSEGVRGVRACEGHGVKRCSW